MEKKFNNNFSQEENEIRKNVTAREERENSVENISNKAIENLYSRKESYVEKKREAKDLLTKEEKAIRAKLEEEVKKMKSNPSLEEEAEKKVDEIKSLKEKEKLKYLLNLASKKGISFATKVAQKMRDPYTLDMFHDILVMNKLYEHFPK